MCNARGAVEIFRVKLTCQWLNFRYILKIQKTFVRKMCRKCSFVHAVSFYSVDGKIKIELFHQPNWLQPRSLNVPHASHIISHIMIVSVCVQCAQQCVGKSVVKFLIETALNVCLNASSYKNVIVICCAHAEPATCSDRLSVIIGIKHACVKLAK